MLQLCVRGKNKKEMFEGLVKSFSKTSDELLLSATLKDNDDFFEQEKNFLLEYHTHLKEATAKSDRMTKRHKGEHIYHYYCTNVVLNSTKIHNLPV